MAPPTGPEFRIRLGNPWIMHYHWDELTREVTRLFQPVIDAQRHFASVSVLGTLIRPTLLPHELLIYVVPNLGYGLARRRNERVTPEATGLSWPHFPDGICNEVYVSPDAEEITSPGDDTRIIYVGYLKKRIFVQNKLDPAHVAKLIYHEALHSRTNLSDNKLHNHVPVSRRALRAGTIGPDNRQDELDVKLMAAHLQDNRRQWSGGWDFLPTRP